MGEIWGRYGGDHLLHRALETLPVAELLGALLVRVRATVRAGVRVRVRGWLGLGGG
jgi:hypothetical protein